MDTMPLNHTSINYLQFIKYVLIINTRFLHHFIMSGYVCQLLSVHPSVNKQCFFFQTVTITCLYCHFLLKYVQIITISDMSIFPLDCMKSHQHITCYLGVFGPYVMSMRNIWKWQGLETRNEVERKVVFSSFYVSIVTGKQNCKNTIMNQCQPE